MPIYYPSQTTPLFFRDAEDATLNSGWRGKFNAFIVDTDINLTIDANVFIAANSEIIIRNISDSTANINVLPANGVIIDISPDLLPVVAPGGIAQLKKLGNSDVWSMYGYIELS